MRNGSGHCQPPPVHCDDDEINVDGHCVPRPVTGPCSLADVVLLEDLLKNGTEEEQQSMTTQIGALEAAPGQPAQGTIKLDKPGDYLALCPVPVGSMTGPASGALPHFMKGMYTLFTVK